MDTSDLTRSDLIAIALGVANTMITVFAVIFVEVWRYYIRRSTGYRLKAAHKDEENLAPEVIENEIDLGVSRLQRLNGNKTCAVHNRYNSYTELSRILGSPPPYPISLKNHPPKIKIKPKL